MNRALRESDRPPVLVVGSGLLHESGLGQIADWIYLLEVAANAVKTRFDPLLANEHPSLYWDTLMAEGAKNQCRSATDVEVDARNAIIALIKSCVWNSRNVTIGEQLLQCRIRSIVSLNFTITPFTNARVKGRVSKLATDGVDIGGTTIWLPHGCVQPAIKLKLGVRAYAGTIAALDRARGLARDEEIRPGKHGRSMMTDVLSSPLVFAGCGLRDAEWSLWWMLATKRRNEARQEACKCYFLTIDPIPAVFRRRCEMLNCVPIREACPHRLWAGLIAALAKDPAT